MENSSSSSAEITKWSEEDQLKPSAREVKSKSSADEKDKFISALVRQYGDPEEQLYPILKTVQKKYRYLSLSLQEQLCREMGIPTALLANIVTSDSQFRDAPVGKYTITVYSETAFFSEKTSQVWHAVRESLALESDNDTDSQGLFTVKKGESCEFSSLAPVLDINGIRYGHLTPELVPVVLTDFLAQIAKPEVSQTERQNITEEIRIAKGDTNLYQSCWDTSRALVMEYKIPVSVVLCDDICPCHQLPFMEIHSEKGFSIFYPKIQPEMIAPILMNRYLSDKQPNRSSQIGLQPQRNLQPQASSQIQASSQQPGLLFRWANKIRSFWEGKQTSLIGKTSPSPKEDSHDKQNLIESAPCWEEMDFSLHNEKALLEKEMAAFCYVLKSQTQKPILLSLTTLLPKSAMISFLHQQTIEKKVEYLVGEVNDHDPNSLTSQALLESNPFRIIEGFLIAARLTGAKHGIIVIPDNNVLAMARAQKALSLLEKNCYLGERILDSDFSFTLSIKDSFELSWFLNKKCSNTLMKIGQCPSFFRWNRNALNHKQWNQNKFHQELSSQDPLSKEDCFLFEKLERFFLISREIRQICIKSKAELKAELKNGTKLITLLGRVYRSGLVEVPSGLSLRALITDYGGGVSGSGKLKAVLWGGPFGVIIPVADIDNYNIDSVRIDSNTLSARDGDCIDGDSVIILDDNDSLEDLICLCLKWIQKQSCGRCTFGRIGMKRLLEIFSRCLSESVKGTGTEPDNSSDKESDWSALQALAHSIQKGSLCSWCQQGPNLLLSSIGYLRKDSPKKCNELEA